MSSICVSVEEDDDVVNDVDDWIALVRDHPVYPEI